MNKKQYILLALILLTLCQGMMAKNKTVQKVYIWLLCLIPRLYSIFHRYSGVRKCQCGRENKFPV